MQAESGSGCEWLSIGAGVASCDAMRYSKGIGGEALHGHRQT